MKREIKYRLGIIWLVLPLVLLCACKEQKEEKQDELCGDFLCEEVKEMAKIGRDIKTLIEEKRSLDIKLSNRLILEDSREDKIILTCPNNDVSIHGAYVSVKHKHLARELEDVCDKILTKKDSLRRMENGPYGERFWKKMFGESIIDFSDAMNKVYFREGGYGGIEVLIEKDIAGVFWPNFVRKLYDLHLYKWDRNYDRSYRERNFWSLVITPSDLNKPVIRFYGKYSNPNLKDLMEVIGGAKGTIDLKKEKCDNSGYTKGIVKTLSNDDIIIDTEIFRSKKDIMQGFNGRMPGLRNIYTRKLICKSGFSGKITLKFTIVANGEISSIEIIESSTDYPEFDNEIKDKVSTWKWKPIEKGSVTVSADFYFTE